MKQHLQSLQAYRGFAALGVGAYHLTLAANDELRGRYQGGTFEVGEVGVDFFFVLSGFIITLIHRKDIGVASAAPQYLLKRVFRIYPLVFLACALKLAYLLLASDPSDAHKTDPYLVVASFALLPLPDNSNYLIGVMWTLSHEMLFYLFFLIPIFFGLRAAVVTAACWVLAIVVYNLTHHQYQPERLTPLSFLARPCNLEFLLGCVVAFLPSLAKRTGLAWGLLAAAGAWLAMAFFVSERYVTSEFNHGPLDLGYRLAWGPGFALLIYATIALEGRYAFRVPAVLLLIGNASYSIYLFHTSAIALGMKLVHKASSAVDHLPVWVALAGTSALTLIVGVGVYSLFEKPVLGYSRKLIPRLLSLKT